MSITVRPTPGWEYECRDCGEMVDGFDDEDEAEEAGLRHLREEHMGLDATVARAEEEE